jgi:hypothetical protein
MQTLTPEFAAGFARVALANVTREYPRKLDHLLIAPHGDLTARILHPAFYGSYDWHSAVHMHWLLVRVLRLHPGLPEAAEIAKVLDAHLAPGCIAAEHAYFEGPGRRTFERPYGWAWLLELQAEALRLAGHNEHARRWANALEALAKLLAGRLLEFISLAPYPIRIGMHPSTAFACILALDYARVAGDDSLATGIGSAARKWHLGDRDAPLAYEPSLADFLSPALVEAQLMREVLAPEEFRPWLDAFLPRGLGPLAVPPVVADRGDAQVVHLDGLSLSRAWALRRIASALEEKDPRRDTFAAVADRHLAAGLPQVVGGDYVGEHWLASFAALALGGSP